MKNIIKVILVVLMATVVTLLVILKVAHATIPANATKFRPILTREAHFVYGLSAPIPMFAAQIEQESGWRPGVTAWDNGRGLAQFMDATSETIYHIAPSIGKPQPYNPVWAITALTRYDQWIYNRVKGSDPCQKWGAALKGYNAGLGYVQQAQGHSGTPSVWFDKTEFIKTRQSAKNFEYSRMYPRWILITRQPKYKSWGAYTCQEIRQ